MYETLLSWFNLLLSWKKSHWVLYVHNIDKSEIYILELLTVDERAGLKEAWWSQDTVHEAIFELLREGLP